MLEPEVQIKKWQEKFIKNIEHKKLIKSRQKNYLFKLTNEKWRSVPTSISLPIWIIDYVEKLKKNKVIRSKSQFYEEIIDQFLDLINKMFSNTNQLSQGRETITISLTQKKQDELKEIASNRQFGLSKSELFRIAVMFKIFGFLDNIENDIKKNETTINDDEVLVSLENGESKKYKIVKK